MLCQLTSLLVSLLLQRANRCATNSSTNNEVEERDIGPGGKGD